MRKSLLLVLVLLASASLADEKLQKPAAINLSHDGEKWAEKTLRKMSLEEKVGQIFMIRGETEFMNLNSARYQTLRDTIRKYHIGAVLLTVRADSTGFVYRNQPYEAAMLTNQLQRDAGPVPLIFAADFERGLCMRFYGTSCFPHSMAFGATGHPEYAERFGAIVGQESRAVGVEWELFPIADVNADPDNPVINIRSFGEDPQQVSAYVAAFVRGARANGLLTTAKHFPGHGDTGVDSHVGLPLLSGDRAHLDQVELPPFRAAIAAGTDSIMLAHMKVPALEDDPQRVATDSPKIIQGLIKQDLGFQGLVIPDAMEMGGFTRSFTDANGQPDPRRAVVEAVKAGNDMVLLPWDLDAAYNAILAAVRSGEIPQAQLDASVLKVLKAKASVGLNKARLVDINALSTVLARPENVAFGQQVADEAVTLVRDNSAVLPVRFRGTITSLTPYSKVVEPQNHLFALVISEDLRADSGRVFEQELKARIPDANVVYVDPRSAAAMTPQIVQAAAQADTVLVAIYEPPLPGRVINDANGNPTNTVALRTGSAALLHALLQAAPHKTVVAAMGNPYLAAQFPEIENYLCAYSHEAVSERAIIKAIFGEIPIGGHLPVTIPHIAERGAGILRPASPGGIHATP